MKFKSLYNGLKLRWNITTFRLCVSIGMAPWAKHFLERIPLPEHALEESTFQSEEQKLWKKYIDLDGNLRLITWKGFFTPLLKIAALGAAAFLLIIVSSNRAGKIIEPGVQQKKVSITDFQKNEEPTFKLSDNQSLVVDINRTPIFYHEELYLPVVFKMGSKEHVFYLPGKDFPGETGTLEDCRRVRKYVRTDGQSVYYVYSTGSELSGTWMKETELAHLRASIEPGTGIMILPKDQLSRELRKEPARESELILTIPANTKVEFIQFAPIAAASSGLIWVQVKNTMESGKCFRGWIAVFALSQSYVKTVPGSNMIEVTDLDGLWFRDSDGNGRKEVDGVGNIPSGKQAKFLNFAPLSIILTLNQIKIQVQYTYTENSAVGSSKTVTGWVNAGKLSKKLIDSIEVLEKNINKAGK